MNTPKPRKIRSRTHKCFGIHSRIIDKEAVIESAALKKRGIDNGVGRRQPGSKQVDGDAYRKGDTRFRTRAELRNDAEREHDE